MAYNPDDIIKAALVPDPEDGDTLPQEDQDNVQADEAEDKTGEVTDDAATDEGGDEGEEDDKQEGEDQKAEADKKDEAEEDKAEEADKSDEPKLSRKEKREQRKRDFLAESRRERAATQSDLKTPEYKPLDYDSKDNFDAEELDADRKAGQESAFAEGAKIERFVQEQERFWDNVTNESKILTTDPKFAFLNESNPDTFDPDRADTINELYLATVGFNEVPVKNEQGQQLFDPKTGQPLVQRTVARTDISYEKFVKNFVERVEGWVEDREEESGKNLAEQSRKRGVSPTGGSHKGLGKIKPGDISKMSDEEFARHEAEIDRQILAELEG